MADPRIEYDPLTGEPIVQTPPRADVPKSPETDSLETLGPVTEYGNDAFASAYERAVNAGSDKGVAGMIPKSDSDLLNAFNQGVGYFADMGLAATEVADAAMKYAIGAVAGSVANDKGSADRLTRDLIGMTEFSMGFGPSAYAGIVDDVSAASKSTKQFTNSFKDAADELYSTDDLWDVDFEPIGNPLGEQLTDVNAIDWDKVLAELGLGQQSKPVDVFKEKADTYFKETYDNLKSQIAGHGNTYGDEDALKVLETIGKDKLIELGKEAPHWQDFKTPEELDAFDAKLSGIAKQYGLDEKHLKYQIDALSSLRPSQREEDMLGAFPAKTPIGERAGSGPARPSDPKAEALGFNEHVYHFTNSPGEFTDFFTGDIEQGRRKGQNPHDYLGVHVGTARASNERGFAVQQTPSGHTMELRARTEKPLTKDEMKQQLSTYYNVDDAFSKGPETTEGDIKTYINLMSDLTGYDEYDTVGYLRNLLPAEGYTHIPYVNDVEDKGNLSYIMLVDRPSDSPAVLRDVRAKFDPEKVNERDLRFADGGVVTKGIDNQMDNLLETGGLNASSETVDPVSGNEVPVGSTPKEVRDDIDAKLSENEYVVPADVVKFYGVHFFEKLRKKAKEGLAEMDQEGRIGGGKAEPEMEDDEELPFDISELETMGDDEEGGMPAFAEGGAVTGPSQADVAQFTSSWNPNNFQYGFSTTPQGQQYSTPQQPQQPQTTSKTYVNAEGRTMVIMFDANGKPTTPIPAGFYELGTTPPQTQEVRGSDSDYTPPENIDVKEFDIQDFQDVLNQADFTQGLARTMAAVAPPLGAAIQSGYNETRRNSLEEINRRLESGGLTPEQTAQLNKLKSDYESAGVSTTAKPGGGLGISRLIEGVRDFFTGETPTTNTQQQSTAPRPTQWDGGRVVNDSDGYTPPSTAAEAQQEARDAADRLGVGLATGGRAKGGLVTKKTKLKTEPKPRRKIKAVEK